MQKAARDPAVQADFPAHELIGTTPDEFRAFLAEEYAKMGELLKGLEG